MNAMLNSPLRLARAATLALAVVATLGCANDRAVAQTPQPTPQPATAPAASQPASQLDAILDRLHDVGANMKTLRADVTMETVEAISGRPSERRGWFLLERLGDGDTRGRVEFTDLVSTVGRSRRLVKERLEYVLTGDWVVDRAYRRPGDATGGNRETWRQIRPPGSKTDLLKLGAGPFPLPIGQPPEAVREQFEVKLLPSSAERPKLTGVELKPRESNQLSQQFSSIVIWIAPDASLPSVIETVDRNESKMQTTTLSNVKLNEPVTEEDFKLEPIDEKDWQIVKEPYREAR